MPSVTDMWKRGKIRKLKKKATVGFAYASDT